MPSFMPLLLTNKTLIKYWKFHTHTVCSWHFLHSFVSSVNLAGEMMSLSEIVSMFHSIKHLVTCTYLAKYMIEALPVEGRGGEVLVPLFPSKKWPCSPKTKSCFSMFPVPKIACVPLFPLFLGLCSHAPLKKLALVPLFPKTPGRIS